ncbi:hypothetical protein FOZ62_001146, partial [Perkinsus olseni]
VLGEEQAVLGADISWPSIRADPIRSKGGADHLRIKVLGELAGRNDQILGTAAVAFVWTTTVHSDRPPRTAIGGMETRGFSSVSPRYIIDAEATGFDDTTNCKLQEA